MTGIDGGLEMEQYAKALYNSMATLLLAMRADGAEDLDVLVEDWDDLTEPHKIRFLSTATLLWFKPLMTEVIMVSAMQRMGG